MSPFHMIRAVLVGMAAISVTATFTIQSGLSTRTSLTSVNDGITPINDVGADERGLTDVFGSDPSIDPTMGMVSSGPFGSVSFFSLQSGLTTFSTTEERVYTTPNRYAPSAICDGLVAVADRNLKFFQKQAGVWTQVASVGDESGPNQLFFPDRTSRRLRWHCNGGESTIVANSGGPELITPDLTYRPAIHVFRNTAGTPSVYQHHAALNITSWVLPREDGAATAGDTLFSNQWYIYDDFTQRFVYTALERVAVSRTYVASLAAFFPSTFSTQQGFPLFAWRVRPDSSTELLSTRGSKACAGTGVQRTAQISIDMFETGRQITWMDDEPIIVVGCPAAQGGSEPVIEVWRRAPRIACDADIIVLEKIPDLFTARGTGDFPGLAPIDMLPDNGVNSGVGITSSGLDPDSMAPSLRILQDSIYDDFSEASVRILVGDPGFDTDAVVDAGRAFIVKLTLDPSQPDVLSLYNVFVEKIIDAASPQAAEHFGGLGAGGVQGTTVDLIAIASPRRTPLPTLSVTASTRADQQLLVAPNRFANEYYFDGFSMDATDRWLAVAEDVGVRVYSNADGVPGFSPTLQTAKQEKPEEHSLVLNVPHPYTDGGFPFDNAGRPLRGIPLVKFVPATVSFDGRPRLVVVHLPSASSTRWNITSFVPRLSSDATADFAYDEVLADDLTWVKDQSMRLPPGYTPCATMTNPCEGSGIEHCYPYHNATCAQRIVPLELPRGHSRTPVDEGLSKRQSGQWTPADWEWAQAGTGPGAGRGLPGCEDGVALGVPDAGTVPAIVAVCLRNVRRSATTGEIFELMPRVVPQQRSDARIVLGEACAVRGVPSCVNTTFRGAGLQAKDMEAGTRILSGQLAGALIVGANNDAKRMELFRFDVVAGAFVAVTSPAGSGPQTPATVHPIESLPRRDVAAVEGADVIITPGAGNKMLVHCLVATADGLKIQGCGTLSPPAAITAVNDKCGTAEFGTSVIADKSMLINEGIIAIASTNLKSVASCTARTLATAQSEVLSIYTVAMHPLQRARMLDTGFDRQPSSATGHVRRSLLTMGDAAGHGVTNHTRLLDYLAQHEIPATDLQLPEIHFLDSIEFTSVGISAPAIDNVGVASGWPGIALDRALALRSGAWTIVRTGQSPGIWHQAGQLGGAEQIARRTVVSMQGTVEPLDVLRAGAGHLRIFRQAPRGVLQMDRQIVAVAANSAARDTNGGTLFSPMRSLSGSVAAACSVAPNFCSPVVIIGSQQGEPVTYFPAAQEQTHLPDVDAAQELSGIVSLKGTSTFTVRRTDAWAGFNITIRGAGIDRTRLVLELPPNTSTLIRNTPFTASGLHLQELTVDGGYSVLQVTDSQTNGLAGGGVLTLAGGRGLEPRLHLERVRVVNGGSTASGGLISASSAEVTIVDSILGNGKAQLRGGVLSLVSSNALVARSLMSNSSSTTQDGGCIAMQSASTLMIDQSTLEACRSGAAGGALAVSESVAFVTRSDFHQCSAFTNGGAVDVSFGKVMVWMSGFSANAADADGGAVHISQSSPASSLGTSVFSDSSFVVNSGANGGAMRVVASGLVRTLRSGFAFNRASGSGGAIALASQSSLWTDGGSVFRANVAETNGGGAESSALGRMYLAGTRLVENYALSGGGVACTGGGSMSAEADTQASRTMTGFQLSAAERERLQFNSTSSLSGVVFVENTARRTGGGMTSVSCNGMLVSPLFSSNHIGVAAGTIHAVSLLQAMQPDVVSPMRRPWRMDSRGPFLRVASQSTVFVAEDATIPSFPSLRIGVEDQFTLPSTTSHRAVFLSAQKVGATTNLVPLGRLDSSLPSLDNTLAGFDTSTPANTRVAESLADGGGGIYASYLGQISELRMFELFDPQFVDNSAAGGSGGCIHAAGISDNTDCVANPGKCFREGTLTDTQARLYFRVSYAVSLRRCRALRGAAVYWSQIPFIGSTDIAQANGLAPLDLSPNFPANTSMTVTLAANSRAAVPGTLQAQPDSTDDASPTDDPFAEFYQQYGDDAKYDYGYEYGYGYGAGGGDDAPTAPPSNPYGDDDFLFFGDPIGNDDFADSPLADDFGGPPITDDNDIVTPPAHDDAVEPPAHDDAVEPPAHDDAVEPPAHDDAVEPPANDDKVEPPANDDNIAPPLLNDDFGTMPAPPSPPSPAQTRRRRRMQTQAVAQPPVIETMPATVRFLPGFGIRSTVEPGGQVSTIQGKLELERLDAYGTASTTGGFSATARVTRQNYSASLIGETTAVAAASSNRIAFGSLQIKAAANVTPVVFTITPLLSAGVLPLVHNFTITTDCPGRQELQAPLFDQCITCAVAQVSDGLTCSNCAPGTVVGPVNASFPRGQCIACPAGRAEQAGVCVDCAAGRFTDSAGQSSCRACDPGQFSAPRSTSCQDCPAGRYSATGVQEECTLCAAGTFASSTKTVTCDSCTPGRFANTAGSKACSGCVGNAIAPTNRTVNCGECTAGQVAIQGKTICGACPAGTQATADESGSLSCRTCPAGSFTANDGELCSSCPDGTIPSVDRTQCLQCHEFARCVAGSFVLQDAIWWAGNPVQVDVDAAGDPWVYIPPSAELHRCPNSLSCNMTLNSEMRASFEFAAALATDQNLTSSQRASILRSRLQGNLAASSAGVDCSPGHTGPRCALCQEGYSRVSSDGSCAECFEVEVNSLVVIAGILVLVGAASFLVNNTYKSNIKNKAGSNVTAGLIRIFMNYLKIQTTLGDFKARAPAVIMAIRQGAATVSSGVPVDVGPVACAFSLNFERQITGVVLMPAAIIAGTGIVCFILYLRAVHCPHRFGWVCCSCIGKGSGQVQPEEAGAALPDGDAWRDASGRPISAALKADMVVNRAAARRTAVPPADRGIVARKYRQFCQSAMVILLFLIYSMLVKQVFTSWSLYPDSINGRNYLAVDFSVHTDSPAYGRITALASIGVGLWVFGIPGVAIFLLYSNRNKLLDDDTQASLGFLYAGYNVGTASMVNTETAEQARRVVNELQKLALQDKLIIDPSQRVLPMDGADDSDTESAAGVNEEHDELAGVVGTTSRFRGDKSGHDSKATAAPAEMAPAAATASGSLTTTPVPAKKAAPGEDADGDAGARDADGDAGALDAVEGDGLELEDMIDETLSEAGAGPGDGIKDGDEPTPSKATRFAVQAGNEDESEPSGDEPSPYRLPQLAMTKSFVTRKHHQRSLKSRLENTEFLESIVNELEATAKHTATTYWYWEVVVLARLVAVTMVAVFVDDVFLQSYAALAIVIASLVAHLTAHPYSDLALNFAESMGLITVLATQLGSLLWFFGDLNLSVLDDTAITIILIILNIAVLVVFGVMLVLSMLGDKRLRSIPYCGKQCSRAFFKERDLRRRFLNAQSRKVALTEAFSKGGDDESSPGKAKRDAVRAVAIGGAAAGVAAGATAGWMSTFS